VNQSMGTIASQRPPELTTPKITVIVPNRNDSRHLPRCIRSILEREDPPDELRNRRALSSISPFGVCTSGPATATRSPSNAYINAGNGSEVRRTSGFATQKNGELLPEKAALWLAPNPRGRELCTSRKGNLKSDDENDKTSGTLIVTTTLSGVVQERFRSSSSFATRSPSG
jgi:hypothetical protein